MKSISVLQIPEVKIRFSDLRPEAAPISLTNLQGPLGLHLIALGVAILVAIMEMACKRIARH